MWHLHTCFTSFPFAGKDASLESGRHFLRERNFSWSNFREGPKLQEDVKQFVLGEIAKL